MDMDSSRLSLSDEAKCTGKYVRYRELPARSISLHRCRREERDIDIEARWTITHESVEEGDLREEVIYITEVSDIANISLFDGLFFLQENPRPTIREFLKTYDF